MTLLPKIVTIMESLKNISQLQLIRLIFQCKDFQRYLLNYLHTGNLNETKYRQRIGEVLRDIEKYRKYREFRFQSTTLEEDIVIKVLDIIMSRNSIFYMLIQYQKVTQQITKETHMKYLESLVLKNFYDEFHCVSVNVDNKQTFQRIVCCTCLTAEEKFPFYCLLDNIAGDVVHVDSITDQTFVRKFQIAAICQVELVIKHLWSMASDDDRNALLNECKQDIPLQLASVLGMGDILKWFLERGVSVNCCHPENRNTILHVAALAGNIGVMEVLMDKGVNVNMLNTSLETPVHAAAAGGSLEALSLLWNNKAVAEPRCKDGNTPLHNAVDKGHLNAVNFLLENGADVNARNNQKCTPLHLAAIRLNLDIINLLIERGADKDAIDCINQTPLLKACFRDHCLVENILLKKWFVKFIAEVSPNCTTELHVAATRGYYKSTLVLLECGADINAKDSKGKTPLHQAVRGGFYDLTNLLLHHHANVFLEDGMQKTAIHEACWFGYQAIVELLLSKQENTTQLLNVRDNKGRTPLHYACRNGHKSLVEFLLNCEGVLYSSDESGRTVLHEAAWNGHEEIVDVILKAHHNKADIINLVDHNGATAMQLASNFNHTSIVNLLQCHGATTSSCENFKDAHHDSKDIKKRNLNLNINEKNKFGDSQLHDAVKMGDTAAVKTMLKHRDIKVNLKNANEDTSLHLAIKNNCPEIVEMLITHKNIDFNARNKDDDTPLHCAVLEQNTEILYMLFRGDVIGKVKVNPRNKFGETPLHLAAKSENLKIVCKLLTRKVDFNAKTSAGKTAIQIAAEKGNLEIVQRLIECYNHLDILNGNGETILHLSIKHKRERLTEWILENHSDLVNLQNCNGNSCLHFAIMSKNLAIVKAVLQAKGVMVNLRNNRQETPLLLLAANWSRVNDEIIKCFLENPAIDVNVKLPNGRNALHLFAGKLDKNGSFVNFHLTTFPCSRYFVKYDIVKNKLISTDLANVQDQDGNSAVHLSACTGNTEMLKLLLDNRGIHINLKNNAGETALHLACREGHIDCVELILKYEQVIVDVEMKEYAWTPLSLALHGNHWNIVDLLLRKGAKVNIEVDSWGSTPLHYLTKENNEQLIEILLERCNFPKDDVKWLNVRATDGNECTALDYARLNQFSYIAGLIAGKMNEN